MTKEYRWERPADFGGGGGGGKQGEAAKEWLEAQDTKQLTARSKVSVRL